jgi:hypothetical protein
MMGGKMASFEKERRDYPTYSGAIKSKTRNIWQHRYIYGAMTLLCSTQVSVASTLLTGAGQYNFFFV